MQVEKFTFLAKMLVSLQEQVDFAAVGLTMDYPDLVVYLEHYFGVEQLK
jgi:hypothetical protein